MSEESREHAKDLQEKARIWEADRAILVRRIKKLNECAALLVKDVAAYGRLYLEAKKLLELVSSTATFVQGQCVIPELTLRMVRDNLDSE